MKRKTKWIIAGCAAAVLIAVSAFWFWPRTFPIPNKPIAAVTVTDMYPDIVEKANVEVDTRVLSAEEYKPLLQKTDKTPYKLRLLQLISFACCNLNVFPVIVYLLPLPTGNKSNIPAIPSNAAK